MQRLDRGEADAGDVERSDRRVVEAEAEERGEVLRHRAEMAPARRVPPEPPGGERQRQHETLRLPDDLDYAGLAGLSTEVRQRLSEGRPATLGQAARLPGITPAAISILLVHLKKRSRAA